MPQIMDADVLQAGLCPGVLPAVVIHAVDAVATVGKDIFRAPLLLIYIGSLLFDEALGVIVEDDDVVDRGFVISGRDYKDATTGFRDRGLPCPAQAANILVAQAAVDR